MRQSRSSLISLVDTPYYHWNKWGQILPFSHLGKKQDPGVITQEESMDLAAFTENDFEQLIRWISSDELNYLWGGPAYSYPLTHEQISTHCAQSEVMPFIFKVAEQHAGFIELFRVSNDHFRICRVFISNEYRGQGLSKKMLESIVVKAQADFGCKIISLAVFEHNRVAKNCYKSLGFNLVAIETGTRSYKGKAWDLVRMEKRL